MRLNAPVQIDQICGRLCGHTAPTKRRKVHPPEHDAVAGLEASAHDAARISVDKRQVPTIKIQQEKLLMKEGGHEECKIFS
jgi:hypothetical protein